MARLNITEISDSLDEAIRKKIIRKKGVMRKGDYKAAVIEALEAWVASE
jgi:hypothetical protein